MIYSEDMNTESAKLVLAEHHSSQAYFPEDCCGKKVVNTKKTYLGSYIPYIGRHYFEAKPRVLIYAMAQNLSRADEPLISKWLATADKGLYRQYEPGSVHVGPYDDGHLKVIAALTLRTYPGTNYSPMDNVDDLVSVTNFIKFSFYQDKPSGGRTDSNPPKSIYNEMWKHYSAYEVDLLQPDIIIGVGNVVANAIRRNLNKEITLIPIPFPGRLNLNSRYIPKGKSLIEKGYKNDDEITGLKALLQGTPDKNGKVENVIRTNWYYFKEMDTRIKGILTKE